MKNNFFISLIVFFVAVFYGCKVKNEKNISQEGNSPPNIILILMDDLGWTATETYGNKYVETPFINSLAEDGMKFTQAYVTPQCTPTRASLLTGAA